MKNKKIHGSCADFYKDNPTPEEREKSLAQLHDLEKRIKFEYLIVSKDDIYKDMLTIKNYRFSIKHVAHIGDKNFDKVIVFGRELDEEIIGELQERYEVYFALPN